MEPRTAFERETLTEVEALTGYAHYLCRDPERAKDLVQETLLRAYIHFDSFMEGTNLRAWLFRILKNAYINDSRLKVREVVLTDFRENGQEETEGFSVKAHLADDDRHFAFESSLGDEVVDSLRTLPVDYQTAVVLSDIEEHSYDEIAEFMDVPVGTVRSRIHRGRNMLAQSLRPLAHNSLVVFHNHRARR